MMLANIVNGRPSQSSNDKTTLLVASQALITQWAREIDLHTNCGFVVMKYTSGNRIDSNRAADILKSHDIILTTYTEIMKSYPKNDPPITCQSEKEKLKWWEETYDAERGPLHRMIL
jgi:SNF2 family DNA or RNA helicase